MEEKRAQKYFDLLQQFGRSGQDTEFKLRAQEFKEAAKIKAKKFSYVRNFFDIITDLNEEQLRVLQNPKNFWNMDERVVDVA